MPRSDVHRKQGSRPRSTDARASKSGKQTISARTVAAALLDVAYPGDLIKAIDLATSGKAEIDRRRILAIAELTAIAGAESGYNLRAIGDIDNPVSGARSRGPYQINSYYHPEVTDECAFNLVCASRETWRISGSGNPDAMRQQWTTYRTGAYRAHLPNAKKELRFLLSNKVDDPSVLERIEDVLKDVADVTADAAGNAIGIVGWIASEVGKSSAKWLLGAGTWVGKILYDEVLHPVWEHTQRATVYYYEEIMSSKKGENSGFYYDYAGLVTVAFWSLGYALLWRDADNGSAVGTNLERTVMGKAVRQVQTQAKSRKLHSPKDAKKEAPRKPKPEVSKADTTVTRYAKVKRRRTVEVGFGKEKGNVKLSSETTPIEKEGKDAENVS